MTDLLTRARAKGTDAEYRAFIQRQPSCVSGRFSEWVNGEGRNPACHVRRAGESGTAHKGHYACIPMTHAEHTLQHTHGEAFVLEAYLGRGFGRDAARVWFDAQRVETLRRWVES